MSGSEHEVATRFQAALHRLEEDGDAGELLRLFADDAEAANLVRTERGHDGVRRFWEDYRSVFRDIHSRFTNVIDSVDAVALEWESEGTLPSGEPIRYQGVSILEVADGQVQRFKTYYDSAAFVLPAGA